MHRSMRRGVHFEQRAPHEVAEILRAVHRTRIGGDRLHHLDVVERLAARVLEKSEAFHLGGDLAADHEHGRAVRHRGRDGRDHVAEAGAADAERDSEFPARTGVAIGHVGGAAFLRGDDGA
jgi:hypothetical protein